MTNIEKVARAICKARYGHLRGYAGREAAYEREAQAAIAAMQPAPQEPVAWMYSHPDDPFPPSVRTDRHDKYDFAAMAKRGWTETPLYAGPTPPNGGSDE